MKIKTLLFSLVICSFGGFAQDVVEPALAAFPDEENVLNINLETVLRLAGADNLQIAAVRDKMDIASARKSAGLQYLFPNILPGTYLFTFNGEAQNTDGSFIDVDKDQQWAGVGISANWNFGESVYKYLAAKQQVETASFEYQATKNQQILNSVTVYMELLGAQAKMHSMDLMLTRTKDIADQISIMVDQGLRYKSDELLAQTRMNQIEIQLNLIVEEIKHLSNRLLNTLNIRDDVILLGEEERLTLVKLFTDRVFSDDFTLPAMDSVYNVRPEVLSMKSNIKSLNYARKTLTTGILLPDIKAGVNEGMFGPAFDPASNQLSYYAGIHWTIPLGELIIGGGRKEYKATISYENHLLAAVQNTIREQVNNAYSSMLSANNNMTAGRKAVTLSEQALSQSIERQKLGTALPLEVFQIQESLIEAKMQYIDAITAYNQAQYKLFVALGNKL
ncbi:MAG: TolC family protein [Bacteroidetes bacterium]|nr:TolC family protein [Bacteroidota bacterium]